MRNLEDEMNAAFSGKFFWEPSTNPNDRDVGGSVAIRQAQRKIAGDVRIVTTKSSPDAINIESVKPMTRILKGEEKVLEPILRAISTAYDVSMDTLMSGTTSYKYSNAKFHLYWAMFRYIPGMSLAEAGRLLDKCHTTVRHGKATFEKNMDKYKVAEVDRLMGAI